MNKQDLISKIKQLEGISQDERAYLINLVNTKKKYGFVWEDKQEDDKETLLSKLIQENHKVSEYYQIYETKLLEN